jgi:hypothetical protein
MTPVQLLPVVHKTLLTTKIKSGGQKPARPYSSLRARVYWVGAAPLEYHGPARQQ